MLLFSALRRRLPQGAELGCVRLMTRVRGRLELDSHLPRLLGTRELRLAHRQQHNAAQERKEAPPHVQIEAIDHRLISQVIGYLVYRSRARGGHAGNTRRTCVSAQRRTR